MTDTKITITPEEADALWVQFCLDCDPEKEGLYWDESTENATRALTLAITRERERCLSIIREVNALNADDPRLIVSKRALEEIEKKIRGEE